MFSPFYHTVWTGGYQIMQCHYSKWIKHKQLKCLTFFFQWPERSCWHLFSEYGQSEGVCLYSFRDVFSKTWLSRGFVKTKPFTKGALGTVIEMV